MALYQSSAHALGVVANDFARQQYDLSDHHDWCAVGVADDAQRFARTTRVADFEHVAAGHSLFCGRVCDYGRIGTTRNTSATVGRTIWHYALARNLWLSGGASGLKLV